MTLSIYLAFFVCYSVCKVLTPGKCPPLRTVQQLLKQGPLQYSFTERHGSISGASQLDEKLSVLSDQKPSFPEKCPASESSKLDEKAKQPVVLNPVTQQQQASLLQEGGQVSAEHLGSESKGNDLS